MMNQALIFNLMGVIMLVTAFVLHTVCLTTPYYAGENMDDFGKEVQKIVQTDPSRLGLKRGMPQEQLESIVSSLGAMAGGSFNFGMWKLCISADQGEEDIHLCALWKTETTFTQENMLKTMESESWIRAVQAMAILGMIFLVLALSTAVVNVVVKSKGDRLRLLYLFIILFCATAAFFILIGDIVMAAKYRSAFDPMMARNEQPPPHQLYELFTDGMSLSWGFVLDIVSVAFTLLACIAHFIGGRIANSSSGIV